MRITYKISYLMTVIEEYRKRYETETRHPELENLLVNILIKFKEIKEM